MKNVNRNVTFYSQTRTVHLNVQSVVNHSGNVIGFGTHPNTHRRKTTSMSTVPQEIQKNETLEGTCTKPFVTHLILSLRTFTVRKYCTLKVYREIWKTGDNWAKFTSLSSKQANWFNVAFSYHERNWPNILCLEFIFFFLIFCQKF